jgi:hypothetical protein
VLCQTGQTGENSLAELKPQKETNMNDDIDHIDEDYASMIQELAQTFMAKPKGVYHILARHQDGCAFWEGRGDCDCIPKVTLHDHWPLTDNEMEQAAK